ncbi:MAG: uroporphyrinogen-III synthase [Paracoccaceae bacterium]
MAPQSRAPTTLLTRPAPQSAHFAALLRARFPGIRVVISPLIAPSFVQLILPDRPWTALIFTSETAVISAQRIAADGQPLPQLAFCVGDHTAEVASAAGFDAKSASGDATALISLILSQNHKGPLLHLRGRESRGDIANALGSAGIETFEAISYHQQSQSLSPEAVASLRADAPIIPLFSPRTAEIFARECSRIQLTAPLMIIAISAAVAASAPPSTCIVTATHPDAEAMLDAIAGVMMSEP